MMELIRQKLKSNLRLISKITILWASFIVLSGSFMRQAFDFVRSIISRDMIGYMLWCALFGLVVAIVIYILKLKSFRSLILTLIPLCIALSLAFWMNQAEERVHIIKFGMLGFLLANDFRQSKNTHIILKGTFFGLIVAIMDETFQWILPYRVGDIRDVCFDTISSFIGTLIFISMFKVSKMPARTSQVKTALRQSE